MFRALVLVAVGVVAAVVALVSWTTGAVSALEHDSIDARFSVRGAKGPDRRIVIVGLDARTLSALNLRPPIPRIYFARALNVLHDDGARLIVLDIEFDGRGPVAAQDAALLAAISRDRPVVMGAADPGARALRPVGAASAPGATLARLGVDADNDGMIRRMLYEQVGVPTLAVTSARLFAGRPVNPGEFSDDQAWIDFRGPPGTFPAISLSRLLAGSVPASEVRGKIVMIGDTAPILKDVFTTAASSTPMAGVEVQANALSTALDDFPLHSPSALVIALIIVLVCALPILLGARVAALYVLGGSLLSAVVYLVIVQLTFDHGVILPLINPMIALVLATAGVIGVEGLVDRRRRVALEKALSDLLRPARSSFFISYRRDQASFAANILRRVLVERFGESSVFKDTHAIYAGEVWSREIQEGILGAQVMLVLIGPYWLGAPGETKGARRLDDPEDWVRREIAAGLSRPTLVVVPVLLDGAAIPAVDELPTALAGIHHRNAVALSGDRLDEEVDQLVNSIENGHIARLLVEAGRPAFLTINGPAPQRVRVNSELVLGSATDADVVVTGEGVAERHARMWPVPEGLIVEDLGSSGGTLIDGRRINAASTITRPAELTLGRTTVTISVADETDQNGEIRLWPTSSAHADDLVARDADA